MTKLQVPAKARFLYKPARYKGLRGGRGSAKSTSVADALILTGISKPLRILCAREIQKSLRTSVYQLLLDRMAAHGISDAYRPTERGIFGRNGVKTEFLFAGLRTNADNVKSMEGLDVVWLEEADRISQTSLDLLTPTLRKDGSELWATWNRRHVTDPVDNMFLGGEPPPGAICMEMNWRDNPFFPESLRVEMEWMKRRDKDKWLHIWEGHPLKRSDAQVFSNWTVDDLDDVVAARRPAIRARYGADWGMRDPTVLIKIYRIGRTLYIAREAYKVEAIIDELPALFAGSDPHVDKRWENKWQHPGIEGVLQAQIVADSAYPQTIRFLRDRGLDVRPAKKGAGSIEEGVEFIKTHDVVIHPSCTHCIDEFSTFSYKIDPITDEVLPELGDEDNHVVDAVRYALEGERRALNRRTVSINVETVPL